MRNKRQGSNKVSHKADTQKCKEMFINHFETITINIIIAFYIIYSLITAFEKKKVWKLEHQPSSLAYTFLIAITSPSSFLKMQFVCDCWFLSLSPRLSQLVVDRSYQPKVSVFDDLGMKMKNQLSFPRITSNTFIVLLFTYVPGLAWICGRAEILQWAPWLWCSGGSPVYQ